MEVQDGAGQGPATDNSGNAQAQGQGVAADFLTELNTDSGTGSATAPLAQEGQTMPKGSQEPAGSAPATEQKLPGFTAAATKELRSEPRFVAWASKFKSFDDAMKSAIELESKMGAMAAIPGENATPEQKADFFKKIGVPENINDYELTKLEGVQYDEVAEKEFRELAKNLNLTKDQAKGLYEYASQKSLAMQTQIEQSEAEQQNAVKAERQSTEDALRKDWGEDYDANREVLKRGFREFIKPDFAKRLQERGMGNDPDMMRLLYTLGKTVMEDPGAFSRTASIDSNGRPQLEYPGL